MLDGVAQGLGRYAPAGLAMTEQQAMQIAQQEYARLILDGMGIFLIAEAWGIERQYPGSMGALSLDLIWIDTPERLKQRGLLSEPYVLAEMAKQIMEMGFEEEEQQPVGRGQSGFGQVRYLQQVAPS